MKQVFDLNQDTLPTIEQWNKYIAFDRSSMLWNENSLDLHLDTFKIRNEYTKHCFPILSHEFLKVLKCFCNQFKIIADIGCGEGWLSYWMKKYDINVKYSIDSKDWPSFKKYFRFVQEEDGIVFVKENNDVDLVILSWPEYDSPFAYNIWNVMKKGQVLLYIGEGHGGCTADDKFHDAIQKFEIEDKWKLTENFRAFYGVHDYSQIYRK